MVEQSLQGAINVVQFSGPLRGDNVAQVSAALAEPMRRGQPAAVLDLRKVTLMDSAALEMLVEMQAGFQWRGGCLKLTSPNRLCEEILAITGVAEQFEFHSDVGKAVGSFA